jgi:hypothetical protein
MLVVTALPRVLRERKGREGRRQKAEPKEEERN